MSKNSLYLYVVKSFLRQEAQSGSSTKVRERTSAMSKDKGRKETKKPKQAKATQS